MIKDLENKIFEINDEANFNELALSIFRFQAENTEVYKEYINHLKVNPEKITNYKDIPFLPIEFFKTRKINNQSTFDVEFKSSGTTSRNRSSHFVHSKKLYETSIEQGIKSFIKLDNDTVILALLPNYIEQGDSSLIYMVNHLIKNTFSIGKHFYLYNHSELKAQIENLSKSGKKIVLFGVSYALLDFIESCQLVNQQITIIETGGMKGRKKELTKNEVLKQLEKGFPNAKILSEYGMTELLSQCYSIYNEYSEPNWVKILFREPQDPFNLEVDSGAINIIDLANIYSCSFIETQDLGKHLSNGKFEILGRLDHSEIRGCNLLVSNQ